MAINKNFVVKNGIEVNDNLIIADADQNKVGIDTSVLTHTFNVNGGIGATDVTVTGITTVLTELRVGTSGTVFSVIAGPVGTGQSIGVGTSQPGYLLDVRSPVSTGQTALYVEGDVRITGDLNVDDIVFDDATIQDLIVSGISTIGTLGVSGVTTTQNLQVAGISTFIGGQIVSGISTLQGVDISQQLNVSGISTFHQVDISGQLLVGGATTLASSGGITTVGGDFYVGGDLYVSDDLVFDEFTGRNINATGISTIGTLGVSGVTTTKNLQVTGISTLSTLSVGGTSLFNSNVDINASIDVSGQTEVNNLNVSGITTIQNLDVQGDFDVYDVTATFHNNLSILGNLSIGGTSNVITSQQINVLDKDIILGLTTNISLEDISTEITANGGGISIASTEGSPLVPFQLVGVSSQPNTYKQIKWFAKNTFGIGTTDAWLFNYAVGIGSTHVPNGVILAAGGIQITDSTLSTPQLNVSGIATIGNGSVVVGGASTELIVYGDARITGILTVGTGSITIDGNNDKITVGTGLTITSSGSGNFNDNLYVAGVVTATSFYGSFYGNGSNISGVTYSSTAGISTYANTSGIATYAGYATSAGISTNVIITDTTTSASAHYITFVDGTSGNRTLRVDSTGMTYIPDSNTLSANISGNAATVTTNANLTGDITSTGNATAIAAGVIVNDDISASAAIAVSKLAASTISGVTLGNNLSTLTLNTSGNGLSGASSYNGSGTATFTVTSNATSANTASAIVSRDSSGNFSAGTITANLSGTATNAETLDGIDSSQFLRSDTDDTITGVLTFNAIPAFNGGTSLSTPPFTVDSTLTVSNLNADLLDGQHGSYYQPASSAITNSDTQGSNIYIRNSSPTLYLRDTNHNVSMLHCDSNLLYVLRGANDSTTWTQVNSQWPFSFNLANNDATCGGNFSAVGNVTAYSSDRRLKENFRQIDNALEKVMSLNGLYFDWKDEVHELGFTPDQNKNDTGLIAQEVQEVLPQAVKPAPFDQLWDSESQKNVSKSGENYITVQYEKVVPLLIEAIKEQQAQINNLKKEINDLKNS